MNNNHESLLEIPAPKPWLVNFIRYFLGFVFVVAGFSKLFPLKSFLRQISAYHLPLSDEFLYYSSIFLIAIEIWVGLSILINSNLRLSLFVAQSLLLGMIPITIWGIVHKAPTCGCYGDLIHREPWVATIEDCLLLLVSLFLLPYAKQNPQTKKSFLYYKIIIVALITLGAFVFGLIQLQSFMSVSPISKLP